MKRLGNTVIEEKVRSACFEMKSSDISKSARNTYHKKKEKEKRKKKDIDDSNRDNRKRFNWQGRWKMERRRIEK